VWKGDVGVMAKHKPKCKRCGSTKGVRLVALKHPVGNWGDKRPVYLCGKCAGRRGMDN
jgi:hypothetical protein